MKVSRTLDNTIYNKDFVIFIQLAKKGVWEIIKFDKIKKINNIIIPEYDSFKISPLSELFSLHDKINLKEKN